MSRKEQISRNFSRSSKNYEKVATFQNSLADELIGITAKLHPKTILDIGCGTGYMTRKLAKRFPRAKIIGVDIAPGMIQIAKKKNRNKNIKFVVYDCELLPKLRSFDLILSNCAIQWMDLNKLKKCLKRNLTRGGVFIFNTFGPNNLKELKAAGFRKNKFPSKKDIKRIFSKHFKKIKISSRFAKQEYKNIRALLKYLVDIGANTPALKGKPDIKKLRQIISSSPSPFYASFEVYSGKME